MHVELCPGLNAATKTAKFMIIRKPTDKVNEIYSYRCREGPSKVTGIAKSTKSFFVCYMYTVMAYLNPASSFEREQKHAHRLCNGV